MEELAVIAPRHWRPEVRDVATTIADAARSDEVRVHFGTAAFLAATRRRRSRAWILSDDGPPLGSQIGVRPRDGDAVFRLWWNHGNEILQAPAPIIDGARHICFFDDAVSADLRTRVDVTVLPYAFTRPVPAFDDRPQEARIVYSGEVDISDQCFGDIGSESERLSSTTWELARAVVDGSLPFIDADVRLGPAESVDHQTLLWALRNRVRYLLVGAVVEAFPGRVLLRGDDWSRVGLPAERTSHRRRVRFAEYRRYRVSLDLGSKSTHAALYPRTAEILAHAGGLAQFSSGLESSTVSGVARRRARSIADLLSIIDDLLTRPVPSLLEENLVLQRSYEGLRRDVGRRFIDMIQRAATAAPGASD